MLCTAGQSPLLIETQERSAVRRAVFADYPAAFDIASRSVILSKLAEAGVDGKLLRLIAAMLPERRVSLEDEVTELSFCPETTGHSGLGSKKT